MNPTKSYSEFDLSHGLILENAFSSYPTNLFGFKDGKLSLSNLTSTYYGFISSGEALLKIKNCEFTIYEGMYFCAPGGPENEINGGEGIVIEKPDYSGVFSLGGPIENRGRLKYIDGCTDSLLISPIKKGDPCLNALYFPSGIDQTAHTHPSDRIGIIYRGTGNCITPSQKFPLKRNGVFVIHEDGIHSFKTEADEEMVVIAFHPDSDFGPEDENHPMINRTIVDGISASKLDHIKTK